MVRNLYDCILIAVLFVLSLVGGAWADCESVYPYYYYSGRESCSNNAGCGGGNGCLNAPQCNYLCPPSVQSGNSYYVLTSEKKPSECFPDANSCLTTGGGLTLCEYRALCTAPCTTSPVSGCPDGQTWDAESCTCKNACNDHIPVPDKCMETWKNGYTTDADGNPGGGGYWAITTYECFYDSCAMSLNCTEKSSFPAGNLTCDDFLDTTSTQNCVAVIGHQCTIQCGNNITKNCDCDGSCDHAKTLSACQCPQMSSSSTGSSSSGESSSSAENNSSSSTAESSSSNDGPSSSNSPLDSTGNGDWEYNYSGVLNEIEWNTRQTATNTNIAAGYLSSIDKWQSTINFNIQEESKKIQSAISSGATHVANAEKATTDSLHHTNELLGEINSSLGPLGDSVEISDISGWLDSSQAIIESLKNPDTTYLNPDSLKNDTTQFKSKYSGLFLSNVYTRNGCYEFKMTRPQQNSKFGRAFSSDIELDFGNLAGTFDMCAIFRGIVRIAGAVLVILISLMSYRAAFSSGSGD